MLVNLSVTISDLSEKKETLAVEFIGFGTTIKELIELYPQALLSSNNKLIWGGRAAYVITHILGKRPNLGRVYNCSMVTSPAYLKSVLIHLNTEYTKLISSSQK